MAAIIITERNAVNYKSSDDRLQAVINNRGMAQLPELPTFPARLRWAREEAKLTQPQLAALCGWESQSRISHYERGRRQPVPEDLQLISAALRKRSVRVSPGWLQWGEDHNLIADPRNPLLRQGVESYDIESGPDVKGMVPIISWIAAGEFAAVEDPFRPGEADEWLPYMRRGSESVVALRVKGDSMTSQFGKSYPDGSVIFVNLEHRAPVSGQRVVAKLATEEEATFKVYVEDAGKKWLKPLNPQHPPIFDPFRIVGTVVGKWEDE